MSGRVFPLEFLLQSSERHRRSYQEAVGEFGSESGAALFEEAVVGRLAELIAEAQSPRGKTADKLRDILKRLRDPATEVSDEEVSEAISNLLDAEKKLGEPAMGNRDSSGQTAMDLLGDAIQEVSRRKRAEFKNLIARAKRPGVIVTDDQISKAAAGVLGVERQGQLLGIEEDRSGAPSAMDLVAEATEFAHNRRKVALKDLIAKAQLPGSAVNSNQLRKALTDVLETERQRQLLGSAEVGGSGPTVMELADQVSRILEVATK